MEDYRQHTGCCVQGCRGHLSQEEAVEEMIHQRQQHNRPSFVESSERDGHTVYRVIAGDGGVVAQGHQLIACEV